MCCEDDSRSILAEQTILAKDASEDILLGNFVEPAEHIIEYGHGLPRVDCTSDGL
jgi:hypothetical protein